ncbi:MAG: hypothetical protein E6I03_05825 [Chloroflexi bacterium]|nr:MAG: hypothetical protein E6I03_05825 [Chloroflexota bacterium]
MAAIAGGVGLAYLLTASAASDLQITLIDCGGHPRRIAIQNKGDAPQNLAGWKLMSDKPNEVFDLGVVGTVGPGVNFYVFNGHKAPLTPLEIGGEWIYGWNPSEILDPSLFVLNDDGKDFIRLVDASQLPWRDVSRLGCLGTTEIPPLEQPTPTPTPPPSNTDPGAGGNTGQTSGNESANAQSDAAQSTGASQNAPASGSTGSTSAGTTAQTANVSGQAVGGPASGVGLLSGSSGQPLGGRLLPLGLLSGVAGAALMFVAVRTLRRALKQPQDGH